jgi:hypothetical protein
MFDLFTYFIYLTLLTTLLLITSYRLKYISQEINFEESPKLRLQHFVAILIISLIVGFRFEVGVDWEGYKTIYNSLKDSTGITFSNQRLEPGYFFINLIISRLGLSYGWMFFTVSLITWYFFFKSVPKLFLRFFIFSLFVDEYFFWGMNGVRQFAAISIWLVATRQIVNRNFFKYILLIILASLFHLSVLILIPFYFIPYFKLNNKYYWIGLFLVTLIIGSSSIFVNFIESIVTYLGQKIEILGILRYVESKMFVINQSTKIGLGYLFRIVLNLFLILISSRVLKAYPQATIYFILFFIGAILFNLSYNIQLLGRINQYFLIMRSVVLAISIYHFWQIPKYRVFVIVFCFLYFLLFLSAIYNSSNKCSPYQFVF